MEVIFMDKSFSTTKIIDAYTSCIWNVEYIGYGDFELYFPMDYTSLTGIEIEGYASIRESDRYMIIESIDVKTSFQEGDYLTISGRSLESILTRRIIREKMILTGSLQNCIMRILYANASITTNENRSLDGLSFKMSDDPAITCLTLDFELEPGDNVYDAIYTICEAFRLGFRILPLDDGQMQFELYSGLDRTYGQDTNPWVVFSPKFENLNDSEMIIDMSSLKNVCICDATIKKQVVDSDGNVSEEEEIVSVEVGSDIKGLTRREMYLSLNNVKVEPVKIEDFGAAKDRVNKWDYMEYVIAGFDRTRYEADMKEYTEMVEKRGTATIEKERVEWKMYQHTPEWQEEHPGENPFYWEEVLIPGDSPSEIKRKQASSLAIASKMPKRSDYYIWKWELTDVSGYNHAIQLAQNQINAEFSNAVANAVSTATATIVSQCKVELAKNAYITKFSGTVDSNVNYAFGIDYNVGDLVQIVNEYNWQTTARIVGIMIVQDTQNGFRICPTFKSDNEAVFDI